MQYLHSSMFGTYWIDCELLKEDKELGKYYIKFLDPWSNEETERWVNKSCINPREF